MYKVGLKSSVARRRFLVMTQSSARGWQLTVFPSHPIKVIDFKHSLLDTPQSYGVRIPIIWRAMASHSVEKVWSCDYVGNSVFQGVWTKTDLGGWTNVMTRNPVNLLHSFITEILQDGENRGEYRLATAAYKQYSIEKKDINIFTIMPWYISVRLVLSYIGSNIQLNYRLPALLIINRSLTPS